MLLKLILSDSQDGCRPTITDSKIGVVSILGHTVKRQNLCARFIYADYASQALYYTSFSVPYVIMHRALEPINKKLHKFIKRPVLTNLHTCRFVTCIKTSLYGIYSFGVQILGITCHYTKKNELKISHNWYVCLNSICKWSHGY